MKTEIPLQKSHPGNKFNPQKTASKNVLFDDIFVFVDGSFCDVLAEQVQSLHWSDFGLVQIHFFLSCCFLTFQAREADKEDKARHIGNSGAMPTLDMVKKCVEILELVAKVGFRHFLLLLCSISLLFKFKFNCLRHPRTFLIKPSSRR